MSIDPELKSTMHEHGIEKIKTMIDLQKKILIITSTPEKFHNLSNEINEIQIINIIKNDNLIYQVQNFNSDLIFQRDDYQIVILDGILELLPEPIEFMNGISKFLSANGKLVCLVSNIANAYSRIDFLDGYFNDLFFDKKLNFFTLEVILLLLSYTGFSLTNIVRIKQEIDFSNTDLNPYVISKNLLDAIFNDPESSTFFYLFEAIPTKKIDYKLRKWSFSFRKNIVTENLKQILEQIKTTYENELNYLKQTNREQYAIIKQLEQTNREQYAIIKQLEQTNRDKDAYIEQLKQIIADKNAQIDEFRNSVLFRLLNKLK